MKYVTKFATKELGLHERLIDDKRRSDSCDKWKGFLNMFGSFTSSVNKVVHFHDRHWSIEEPTEVRSTVAAENASYA